MSYLKSINALSAADNVGGILALQIVRKADVLDIPDPVDGVIYGDITFSPGVSWISWNVTFETARITRNVRSSPDGPYAVNELPFTVPKDSEELADMLHQAEDDEFIVLLQYPGGKTKIFGLLEGPVRFEFDHDSGGALEDGNKFNCRFFYEGPDNIFFYNGEISAPEAGAAPALVRYNGTVIAALAPGESLNITSDFGFTNFYTSS